MAPIEEDEEEESLLTEPLAEDPGPAANETSQADLERIRVYCWACGLLIQLPEESVPEGYVAADIRFTCGNCAADNLPHSTGPAQPRGSKSFSQLLKKLLGRFFLVAIPCVIMLVGASSFYLMWGTTALIPADLASMSLCHVVLAIVLEFQILWNYFVTVFTLPSSPRKGVEFGTQRAAENHRFRDFTLCRRCDAPRPPGAHHCSTCSRCIHDLDHHCVFVHNCIGYENRRTFVLFTFYAVIGCVYPLVMLVLSFLYDPSGAARIFYPTCMPASVQRTFLYVFRHRPYGAAGGFTVIRSTPALPWQEPEKVDEGFLPFRSVLGGSCEDYVNMAVLLLLFTLSSAVVLGVGTLLVQQIYLLAYAATTLDFCRAPLLRDCADNFSGRCRVVVQNILAVMGPPRSWLWPSRGPYSPQFGGRSPPPVLEFLNTPDLPEDVDVKGHEDCTKKEN